MRRYRVLRRSIGLIILASDTQFMASDQYQPQKIILDQSLSMDQI